MKWTLSLLFLVSMNLWARPVVLVSYYDPFGKAPFNNSEKVAKALKARMQASEVEIQLCALNTVFDKSYAQMEDCLKALPKRPALVIGLGEATCDLKIEISTRNYDKTIGPDNEGNERKGKEIIPGAPAFIPMRYPLPQMYCSLSQKERSEIEISSSAGSFVCNNTAYQMNHYHSEEYFGFIHVPAHNCRNVEKKNEAVVKALQTMIESGVKYMDTHYATTPITPHASNEARLPITRDSIADMRSAYDKNPCMKEFFKRAKGVDGGFWSFLD